MDSGNTRRTIDSLGLSVATSCGAIETSANRQRIATAKNLIAFVVRMMGLALFGDIIYGYGVDCGVDCGIR